MIEPHRSTPDEVRDPVAGEPAQPVGRRLRVLADAGPSHMRSPGARLMGRLRRWLGRLDMRFPMGLLMLLAIAAGIAATLRPRTGGPPPPPPTRALREDVQGLLPSAVTRRRLTFLVLGVDSMSSRGRSDTIVLVHLMLDKKMIRALSIPRDCYALIEKPGKPIKDKINHAYAWGGAELTRKAVGKVMGLEIDYFVVIDYSLFRRVVDDMGGVPLDVEKRMYYIDRAGGLKVDLQPGQQILNGDKGLQYVRFRFDPLGDNGRIQRQQRFVAAALDRLKEPGVLFHLSYKLPSLLEYVTTDVPTTLALKLLWNLKDFDAGDLKVRTLPGDGRNVSSEIYHKNIYYFFPDEEGVKAVREQWLLSPEITLPDTRAAGTSAGKGKKKPVPPAGKKPRPGARPRPAGTPPPGPASPTPVRPPDGGVCASGSGGGTAAPDTPGEEGAGAGATGPSNEDETGSEDDPGDDSDDASGDESDDESDVLYEGMASEYEGLDSPALHESTGEEPGEEDPFAPAVPAGGDGVRDIGDEGDGPSGSGSGEP